MELHEAAEEILACSCYRGIAAARIPHCNWRRIIYRAIHLHLILK